MELSVDILRAEMRRTGEYVNCGKQYWRWVAWAEIRVNTSLPSLSINLYRCRTELKLPDKKRPLWGGEIGIDAASKDKSLVDPIKLISSTLSGPVEVAIPEPRLARVASTFETPVWKRRSTDRAEARFRLAMSQMAFAELEVAVPLEAAADEDRWQMTAAAKQRT